MRVNVTPWMFVGLAVAVPLAAAACGGPTTPAKGSDEGIGPAPSSTVDRAAPTLATPEATGSAVPPRGSASPAPSASPVASQAAAPPAPSSSAVSDEAAKEALDLKVASAVREKGGHKKCLDQALDKHPGWKPKKYDLGITIDAQGRVKKVVVDKKKSDTSVPEFLACLVKQLEGETFPAPGREITARLTFPTH
ncbi:MAG: hypothetical protein U0169_13385 [Polyangiaceae bacterium]